MLNPPAQSACPVKTGTNFPNVSPFYWATIPAGQWLILRLFCSKVPYVVCVVENQLGLDTGPTLTVHLGQPDKTATIRRQDIRLLKRYSGPLRARCH